MAMVGGYEVTHWKAHGAPGDATWHVDKNIYNGYMAFDVGTLRFLQFDGQPAVLTDRELMRRKAVAAVLPYDPVLDRVVLLEQVRVGCVGGSESPWLLEVVAGVVDDEDDDVMVTAQRELKEETHLVAQSYHSIVNYWTSPGGSNEYVSVYLAEVDASDVSAYGGVKEEDEDIKLHVFQAGQAFEMLANGVINNAVTLIALQWLQLHHGTLKQSANRKR